MSYQTKILDDSPSSIKQAAEIIRAGDIVGIPTETVYGLAADAFNENAVRKIFAAKGRPADNPLIVHISRMDMFFRAAKELPEEALRCAERFWPGPLTMVLPKSEALPYVTSGGLQTVGIRMPSHPAARALIEQADTPLAAPSANLSGKPSPTSAAHVFEDMNGRIPAIIDGGECRAGVESTVICFENGAARILRPGRVTAEMLRSALGRVIIDDGVLHAVDDSAPAASPGMKYKHYSPKAEVYVINSTAERFREYAKEHTGALCLVFEPSDAPDGAEFICIGKSGEEQANRLFAALREADERGAKTVLARCPQKSGVGLAVYNRLIRAAAFREITL